MIEIIMKATMKLYYKYQPINSKNRKQFYNQAEFILA